MQPKRRRRATARTRTLTLLCAGLLAAAPAAALDAGDPAPGFQAPLLAGSGDIDLARYRGKVVMLDFWASWCPPCLMSLPVLEQLRKEFPATDFQVVAVNLDTDTARARAFLAKRGIGYPSASDPEGSIPERFGLETMPTSYLIDRGGVVRHVHEGFRKGDVDDLRARIRALVTGAGH